MTARRGWREKIEAGLYRSHRTGCPSSADKRPGRRCACPFELQVPGSAPGRSRSVTMTGAVAEARAARRRLLAEGRPAAPVAAVERGTLDEFAGHFFRARSAVLAPSTIAGYEHGYRANVSPALGALDLGDVTRERLEVWIAEYSPSEFSRTMTRSTEPRPSASGLAIPVSSRAGRRHTYWSKRRRIGISSPHNEM